MSQISDVEILTSVKVVKDTSITFIAVNFIGYFDIIIIGNKYRTFFNGKLYHPNVSHTVAKL